MNKYSPLIEAIAKFFPGSVVEDGISDCVLSATIYFDSSKGPGVHFYQQHNETRLKISGVWPKAVYRERNSQYDRTEIMMPTFSETRPLMTVSVDREPEAIAKEIKRKIIPAYLPLYEKEYQRKLDTEKYHKDELETDKLVQIINDASGVTAEVHGKNVSLKFYSIDRDIALQVFAAYQKALKDKKLVEELAG